MKIHSSSLTFSPAGLNQKVGRNNAGQNNDENELSVAKDSQNKNQPSSQKEIEKTLDSVELTSQNNIIKPTDSRTLIALSAYNQEFNAPQHAQLAQLITGIDVHA
jgi:hypothetical protein